MKKAVLYVLVTLAIAIAAFLVFVAMKPAHFRVERTAHIAAPPSAVFDNVNDLHKWNAWSPWMELDPNVKQVYSGPSSGVGQSQAWSGNAKAGQGKMTILESNPAQDVHVQVEFIKPFAATDQAIFTFQPEGGGAAVTWAMEGDNNFFFKLFGTLMNTDKMLGDDFNKGLAKLKTVTEAQQH